MKLSARKNRHTTNNIFLLFLCSFFILVSSTTIRARIFQRWKTSENCDAALESVGGKPAYTAPITLNGGKGTLSIYGFNADIRTVTADICRIFNIPYSGIRNDGVIISNITNQQNVINFIIINIQGSTTVFSFTQSIKDAKKSKQIPVNPLRDLPAYPGAESVFYAKDDNAKTALFTATAGDNINNILSFYQSELENDGWTCPLASPTGNNPTGNLLFYTKNNKICAIFASQKPATQKTYITILRKELSNNEK